MKFLFFACTCAGTSVQENLTTFVPAASAGRDHSLPCLHLMQAQVAG